MARLFKQPPSECSTFRTLRGRVRIKRAQRNALPVDRGLQYQCRIVEHGALRQVQRHLRMLAPLLHPLRG